jgi:hypothetical protein
MDSSTPQRVTLSEGRMSIAGLATRFVQDPGRRLKLEAIGLEALSGYVLRDGDFAPDIRIAGRAWLPQDGLGRAGLAEQASEIPLTVRPLPAGGATTGRILLVLGHGGEEPDFHAALWIPAEMFAALKQDVEAGRAGRLRVTVTTNLWLDEADRDAPPERPVTWQLGPQPDGDGATPARGLAERIEWGAAPEATAPEPTVESAEPTELVGEALGRINWSLRQIALLLVFLLIVAALK